MLRQAHKVGPTSLAARSGTTKTTIIIGTRRDAGKPCPNWPKPDHPFYRELRLNRNYVWDRMMASVSPTKSQLSREVPYES